jgi:hypothetical protein
MHLFNSIGPFLYIFLAGKSVLATSLLMSPIYDFWGMSEFELRVLRKQAGAGATNLATHPPT